MKKLLLSISLAIILLANAGLTKAQSYQFINSTGTYTDLAGATLLTGTTPWDFDDFLIPIGFNYNYMGTMYSDILITTDGYVSLGNNDEDAYLGFYTLLIDRGTVTSDSPISYLLTGTAGNKILKIEFKNVGFFAGPSTSFVNFQIWLYESGHAIETHMGPNSVLDPSTSYLGDPGPIVGPVQFNSTGDDFLYSLLLDGDPSSPVAYVVTIDYIKYLTGTPADGQIYRFEPTPTSLNNNNATFGKVKIYPNPFTNNGTLCFELQHTEQVSIKIVDLLGREIETITDRQFDQGNHQVSLSTNLSSGLYYVRLEAGNNVVTEKIIVNFLK